MAAPDDRSPPTSATGSRAKKLRATTPRNRKVSDRRSRPVAKRAGPEHKNRIARISGGVRNWIKWLRPIADDREWNRAFRDRLKDRRGKRDRFASARACAQ